MLLALLASLTPAHVVPSLAPADVWGRSVREWTADLEGPLHYGPEFFDRLTAVRALGAAERGAERAVPGLVAQLAPRLEEPDDRMHEYLVYTLRAEVAETVARLGEPARDALAEALTGEDPRLRQGAAYSLGVMQHGAAEAADALHAALETERDPMARVWLEMALAGAVPEPAPHVGALADGFTSAARAYRGYSGDGRFTMGDVHFQAQGHLVALGRLGPLAHVAAPALRAQRGRLGSLDTLLEATLLLVDPPAGDDLAAATSVLIDRMLKESSYMPTQHAARMLGDRIVPALRAALAEETRPEDTFAAAAYLFVWVGRAGFPGLRELVTSEDARLAEAALGVLADHAGPEHVALLAPALQQELDDARRERLAAALGRRGGEPALAALGEALKEREVAPQRNALRALEVLVTTAPELDGWRSVARTVKRLERSRDSTVKQAARRLSEFIDAR